MLNTTNATTMIPAAAGYEVISVEAAGELARWPVIGWAIVSAYGYGDGGCILPIALGIVFNADAHAVSLPDGRTLTTAGGVARWYRDARTWASAVHEAMAVRAWHDVGVPHAGEA